MTDVVIRGQMRIPSWVADLQSFCRWADSDSYPRQGWFSYLHGELWLDPSMEEMNHNQLKGVFAIVVGGLIMTAKRGRYFHDRMRLSNKKVDLGTEPDGMFVSRRSLRTRRVVLVEGEGDSPVSVEGVPDMVLEVISPGSIKKDTDVLRELYWSAGIEEYWLVDPTEKPATFEILRWAEKGYVSVPKQRGWLDSKVLGKSLRLTQKDDELGHPEYALKLR